MWNQQTSTTVAGVAQTYAYADVDATERTSAGATAFLNGMLGVARQTTSGTTEQFVRDPYGNLVSMISSAGTRYYTADAVGSIILLTNAASNTAATYTYDAWGSITATTGIIAPTNPWRFQSGYHDTQTGYTKFGTRYYNPTLGRWTQPDPIWGQERYSFAGNNPISNVDPTGYQFLGIDCPFGETDDGGCNGAEEAEEALETIAEEGSAYLVGAVVTGTCAAFVIGITTGIGFAGSAVCGYAGSLAGYGMGYITDDIEF